MYFMLHILTQFGKNISYFAKLFQNRLISHWLLQALNDQNQAAIDDRAPRDERCQRLDQPSRSTHAFNGVKTI